MEIIVRPFEERDRAGFWHVGDMTYRDGKVTPEEERVFRTTTGFVAEVEGKIAGIFSVLDLTCTRGDRAVLKCAGIAGVAVLPEYRHLGVGSAMMRWSIPYLKRAGYQIASLYGFRESFYRKFGYEAAGLRHKISVPTHRLPKIKPELSIQKIGWDQHARLQDCHEVFARQYSGMNVRDEKHWGRVLNDKKTIYVAGDPIEAYAILEHKIDFWEPQWVNEIGWSTPAGYRSIMALLTQICINKSALEWWEPWPSPYITQFLDQGVSACMERAIMYRILDVQGTIEALTPVGAGSFGLELVDELIPENRGPWSVTDDGTGVSCTHGPGDGISTSIQLWTQAYLGHEGALGHVVDSPAKHVDKALRFLPPGPVYCMEFF